MAASGIAEHDEARRRERVYLKKAYLQKQHEEAEREKARRALLDMATKNTTSAKHNIYDCEVQQRLGLASNSRDRVDRQRRDAHREQMKQDYSAKLPNRYSSIDYQSQW